MPTRPQTYRKHKTKCIRRTKPTKWQEIHAEILSRKEPMRTVLLRYGVTAHAYYLYKRKYAGLVPKYESNKGKPHQEIERKLGKYGAYWWPDRLHALRLEAGLTFVDAAKKSGVTDAAIYRYETGRSAPSLYMLDLLLQVYGYRVVLEKIK